MKKLDGSEKLKRLADCAQNGHLQRQICLSIVFWRPIVVLKIPFKLISSWLISDASEVFLEVLDMIGRKANTVLPDEELRPDRQAHGRHADGDFLHCRPFIERTCLLRGCCVGDVSATSTVRFPAFWVLKKLARLPRLIRWRSALTTFCSSWLLAWR